MNPTSWKLVLTLAGASWLGGGCNPFRSSDSDEAPAPPVITPPPATAAATAAPAPLNEVVRYSTTEEADEGVLALKNLVRARKGADYVSEIVATLPAGTEVDRTAKNAGFTLVTWQDDAGLHQGWIDTAQATRTVALVATATTTTTTTTTTNPPIRPPGGLILKPKTPATAKPKPVLRPTKK